MTKPTTKFQKPKRVCVCVCVCVSICIRMNCVCVCVHRGGIRHGVRGREQEAVQQLLQPHLRRRPPPSRRCVCVCVSQHFLCLLSTSFTTHTNTGILLVDNVLWKGKVPQLYGDSIYYVYVVYIYSVCVCVCVCARASITPSGGQGVCERERDA